MDPKKQGSAHALAVRRLERLEEEAEGHAVLQTLGLHATRTDRTIIALRYQLREVKAALLAAASDLDELSPVRDPELQYMRVRCAELEGKTVEVGYVCEDAVEHAHYPQLSGIEVREIWFAGDIGAAVLERVSEDLTQVVERELREEVAHG